MSDVLVFVKNPDGTIRATTAVSTQDGQTVMPDGSVVAATPVTLVPRHALSFLRDDTPFQDQRLFGRDDPGVKVDGASKLGQRFLVHLLTVKGSMPYRPTQGCNFLRQVYQGRAANETDVFSAFAGSLPDVARNMTAEEASTDPPGERFKSARVSSLTVASAAVTARIVVTSQDGTQTALTLPIHLQL